MSSRDWQTRGRELRTERELASPDLAYLLDCVPPDVRDACATALEAGRAIGERRELMGDQSERAPASALPRARAPIPVHPEVWPKWYREERERFRRGDRPPANRHERRALEVAQRVADGAVDAAALEAYRARARMHQRKYRRRWKYLAPRAPSDSRLAMPRPATAQQFIAARSAIADEWGARSVAGAMPAPIAAKLAGWVRQLGPCDAYGSPWASRLVRRTVSTLAAIIFAARPSWRAGYALVTSGMGRARLTEIIGPAPESGRRYSVSSLSHVDYGSLAILEELGILERTQVPGDAVPGADRGFAYAFNHYLVPVGMCDALDEWGDPSRLNPSTPREVLEEIAPWCAAPAAELARLADVRAAALATALATVNEAPPEELRLEELEELEASGELEELEPRPPPD